MWQPSPPLAQRIALAISLLLLISFEGVAQSLRKDLAPGVEWSLSTPAFEAEPRSFPAVAIHLRNETSSAQTLSLHFNLGILGSLGGPNLAVALGAREEKTVLYTLHIPPEATGGSSIPLRAVAGDETVRETSVCIKAVANGKATGDPVDKRFLHPGEKATYKVKIVNTGNIPLHCAIRPTTAPAAASTIVTPENMIVPVGGTAEAAVEVAIDGKVSEFTSFVTSAEVHLAELGSDSARQFLYFYTEIFPQFAPPERTRLFETLKGSVLVGAGAGSGNEDGRNGGDGLVRETLTLDGLIAEDTRFQLIEAAAHPSEGNGNQSSALSALPGGSTRNFFHLGFYNPYFDLEGGEITTAPSRLLSSRETGDGLRAAVRPTGKDNLQLEAFAERNTLTLNRKDVFGATISGAVQNSPLEFWRVGTLSKRGDVGPQGRNWDAIGADTSWNIPLTIPLRAELSAAAGENSEGQNGVAWLAGLHYNRALPGEPDISPLKAGVEFASGDKGYPGQQNGRDDRRAYASYRFSTNPTYLEAYANYNDSEYEVVPNVEKTLAEEQSLLPDFLLTSQSRLINAGLRWNTLAATTGAWHLPSGNAEYQETRLFNKSNFLDQTNERAVALNLQPFNRPGGNPDGTSWNLNLLGRGGVEMRESDSLPEKDSRFVTLGADFNCSMLAPEFFEKIGGPGHVSVDFSGRYTENLDGDSQALNRTGVSVTAAVSWETDTWSVKTGTTVYSYKDDGLSDRVWATISRKVAKDWWAGIEGAYTHRGNGRSSTGGRNESAALLTFRHDFEIPVPWLPRRGQVEGQIFNDLNNNGRREPNEPGLEGVKVAVGVKQTLSGAKGEFSLPPMTSGSYPLEVTPPGEVHFNQSTDHGADKTVLTKGEITRLAIGLTKPSTCEGKIRFIRENSEVDVTPSNIPDDLSGIEIVSTDGAGHTQRSVTRADGFFAIYLDPGIYEIKINSATLKPEQGVSPARITLEVERERIEDLAFTVTERVKHIRKTFTTKNP
jgi:hypothetical protein